MEEEEDSQERLQDFLVNPSYEVRAVVFYDFLGWRSKIAEAGNDPEKIGQLRRMILRHTRSLGGIVQHAWPGVRFSTFSDNIVVTCEAKREAVSRLIIMLAGFQLVSLVDRFLVRGGFTVGPIHHDSVSVFGPALNRAYELESEVANVPRIVVDDRVRDIVGLDYFLINSNEDVCFIDPFTMRFMHLITDLEDDVGEKDIFSTLGMPATGGLTVKAMSPDQFFGTPLNALKPLIRGLCVTRSTKRLRGCTTGLLKYWECHSPVHIRECSQRND
jgi:hypothetical protein